MWVLRHLIREKSLVPPPSLWGAAFRHLFGVRHEEKKTNLAAAGRVNFLLSLDCRQRGTFKPRLIAKY
jgi:hypothetical protein